MAASGAGFTRSRPPRLAEALRPPALACCSLPARGSTGRVLPAATTAAPVLSPILSVKLCLLVAERSPILPTHSRGGPTRPTREQGMATHRVGGEVDSFCARCKMTLAHTILA